MPLAKWYLIANVDALFWMAAIAISLALFIAEQMDEANSPYSPRPVNWKLLAPLIVLLSLMVFVILAAIFVEAFTGRGWR